MATSSLSFLTKGGRANTDHVMAMDSHDISDVASVPMVSGPAEPRTSAYRDYEPDNSRQKMKKMNIPVLDNCLISNESLQMSQRYSMLTSTWKKDIPGSRNMKDLDLSLKFNDL